MRRYKVSQRFNTPLPARDHQLIQIVDAALADARERCGPWLVCRPGCTQCCIGPFPISQLDVARLQAGMEELENRDPERAARIRQRAGDAVARLSPGFPGDPLTGILGENEEAEAAFEHFADHEPCPVLDPESGTCELYAHRPMTCREFGPPVRIEEEGENAFSVCELCFQGATPEEVAACKMVPDPDGLEAELLQECEQSSRKTGVTIVAFALARHT